MQEFNKFSKFLIFINKDLRQLYKICLKSSLEHTKIYNEHKRIELLKSVEEDKIE